MGRKLQFQIDDDSSELILRYEKFVAGTGPGYFDVEELETIVDYYLRKGKTKESRSALDLGLRLHPDNVSLQIKRAKIYLAVGDTQKAMRILDSIADFNEYEFSLLKAEALLKSGRSKEAQFICNKILENESEDVDNVALDIAFVFIADLDIELAIKYLTIGDAYNDSNVDLLFELAFCCEQLAETDKAIATYNRIINIDSFLPEAWFNLGQIYFVQENFTKAINAYDFVLAINDKDSLATLQKAHAHYQLDEFETAMIAYKEYSDLTGEDWQTNLFIGECYEKMENFDHAILYYEKSLLEKTENYDALTGIAICLLEKELFEESIEYAKHALLLNDDLPDAWVYMAEGLVGIDALDEALIAYIKAITLEPEQPDTLMAIANICMDKGDWKTALEYYLDAYKLDNSLEFIELFIAIAQYKNGNINQAIDYLLKAKALSLDAPRLFLEVCPEADEAEFLNL
ncbi:MAG: hypothetical protein AUK44_01645 [Porphyromonadaceae bacterium CG2_30_38_12]|nr:MAG: hypothetical protein AUK44_01645 [Porphyromonadaceae bacterium CG2_30_38_12]